MTANEMKYEFLLLYDKYFEAGAPPYDDKRIGVALTKAEYRVFLRIYSPYINKRKIGFENTELRRRNLDTLLKSETITTTSTGVHPNGYLISLPSDFFLAVEESAKVSAEGNEIPIVPVNHDFYTKNIDNPYKKPYSDLIWRMDAEGSDSNKNTELITDGSDIYSYRLEYLKKLPGITVDSVVTANQVDSVLDESLHHQIVDEAVKIAVASLTDDYQISAIEQEKNES